MLHVNPRPLPDYETNLVVEDCLFEIFERPEPIFIAFNVVG
jgi:hypothetical protein